MSKKTHDAELFCRKTLLRNPAALDLAQRFYDTRADFGPNWPDWCGLPMAATYAILTQGADMSVAAHALAGGPGILELSNLTAALLWTQAKIVYRPDRTLTEELATQPLDGNIPREVLFRMPYPCVFVEHEFKFDNEKAVGFFGWMEYDVNNKMPELRLLYLLQSGYSVSVPVLLPGGTLDDSFNALIKSGIARAATLPPVPAGDLTNYIPTRTDISAAINLLLYLCADEADVPDDTTLRQRRSKDSRGNAKRVAVWDVGLRIGAALRKSYATQRADAGEHEVVVQQATRERAGVRPHVRRAHWHHFWIGPRDGNRKLILKWLPPIPVKLDDSELPTVIYPLKKDDGPAN